MANTGEEDDIHEAVVNQIIASTPETWSVIELSIEYKPYPSGDEGCALSLFNPLSPNEPAQPTDELYQATWRLVQLYKGRNKMWRSAKYVVRMTEDQNWSFSVDFTY